MIMGYCSIGIMKRAPQTRSGQATHGKILWQSERTGRFCKSVLVKMIVAGSNFNINLNETAGG